ncbi:MYG1 exonuclease [Macrosteles quadrilineatus]|uniref:MYG1 exonuclease n=1 Tax=Macrosteles quadrilineatus TaxID=74068 RepID=UPI0023E28B71|nr:MYG1 exonuclease [Macrosteles quadrilineatus]
MYSTIFKRFKKSPIKIGTHNGVFHCDEVLGTYMLQLLFPDSNIVRSRDDNVLKDCDIVIDVGNEYDPEKCRFDHHQKGFNESMSSIIPGKQWTTKLSSAGLVYCHFGKDIIKKILGDSTSIDEVEAVFDHVYENFIQEIDGIDNGIPMFEGEPKYRITTNLSSRCHQFNKQWNTPDSEYNEEASFSEAQKYVGSEFVSKVNRASTIWWPARSMVANAIAKRFNVDPSGQIIELEGHCPWKEHFFNLEKELSIENPILFVIFSDSHRNWRCQAVSVNAGSYVCRQFLHHEWQGLRDEELSKIAGIEGCIFVHHSGFIGGNKSRDGALKMALKTIELNKSSEL